MCPHNNYPLITTTTAVSCVQPRAGREQTWHTEAETTRERERERKKRVRIMDKPAQWQSGDPYSSEPAPVCVCVCVFVCVCVCAREWVHNPFSPEIHQSNTRSHCLSSAILSFFTPLLSSFSRPSDNPCLFFFLSFFFSVLPRTVSLLSNFVLCPPWMNGYGGWGGSGWRDEWVMDERAGWLGRGGKTERNRTPGRGVDWCTCWWRLKKDATHENIYRKKNGLFSSGPLPFIPFYVSRAVSLHPLDGESALCVFRSFGEPTG